MGGSAARKNNVALSAKACNGVILLPGEVFSYNNTTGSRSADKGYQAAPVYVGGASTDEVGGGICQTSSTLYLACLLSNMEITERYAHRYVPAYIDPKSVRLFVAELSPIRERRKHWEQHLDDVYDILKEGSKVAEAKAAQTLHDVRSAMQINYFDDNSLIK